MEFAAQAVLSSPSLRPPRHGQNAIREKNQALNFLRLSSRIDGVCAAGPACRRRVLASRWDPPASYQVASRVESALRMNDVRVPTPSLLAGCALASTTRGGVDPLSPPPRS